MNLLCKWEQVTILLQTLRNVGNKNSLFFCFFSLKIKTNYFVCLAPFLDFRGPNLSAVNYQNPGETLEKIKPTHCYGHYRHYLMEIT